MLLLIGIIIAALTADYPDDAASAQGDTPEPTSEVGSMPLITPVCAIVSSTNRIKESDAMPEITATPEPVNAPKLATDHDIELIARTIWGEAEAVDETKERAAVAWCILNRVNSSGDAIESVILAPYQFYCRVDGIVPQWAVELAEDVVRRWEKEHAGETNVGRTLPAEYLYFVGDGWHNHFSIDWQSTDYWDWSLPDPYNA